MVVGVGRELDRAVDVVGRCVRIQMRSVHRPFRDIRQRRGVLQRVRTQSVRAVYAHVRLVLVEERKRAGEDRLLIDQLRNKTNIQEC